MRTIRRIAVIWLGAVVMAAAAAAVHPRRIAWFVSRDVIYPPPTPAQSAAAINREQVQAAVAAGSTIVDARKPDLFAEGHIPGAINVPADDAASLVDEVAARTLTDELVIVYCGGQLCEDSQIVFDVLKASGFQNVRLYFGGWKDWTEAGFDIEK